MDPYYDLYLKYKKKYLKISNNTIQIGGASKENLQILFNIITEYQDEIPNYFLCPITNQLMYDPVLIMDGFGILHYGIVLV